MKLFILGCNRNVEYVYTRIVWIFAYNHIFGFFPGPLYDQVITIDQNLVVFRLITLSWSVFLLLFLKLINDYSFKHIGVGTVILSILFGVILTISFIYSNELGLRHTRQYLIENYFTDSYQTATQFGSTWTPADVNSPTTGMAYKITDFGPDTTVYVDHMRMRAFYTVPPGGIVEDTSVGSTDWSNYYAAGLNDGHYSFFSHTLGEPSYYLKATNFSFNIPPSQRVLGVTLPRGTKRPQTETLPQEKKGP